MIILPDHTECTSCFACLSICPNSAIEMIADEMGVLYPKINYDSCIECGKCNRVCHLKKNFFFNKSMVVYAAYSTNADERSTSASGGIAAELYNYARNNGWHSYGVVFSHNTRACYKELIDDDDFILAKNSKYFFCNSKDVYKPIKEQLERKEIVLFIGLPCQVAGLISFVGERKDNLITVDLLCHGTCPVSYVDRHIDIIEEKASRSAEHLSFRDPLYNTYTYTLTLKDKQGIFYKANTYQTDVYQIGYHKSLICNENCYHCKYAREERVGDITLSDFSGLGRIVPYNNSKHSVSCVVVSSDKGFELLKELEEKNSVIIEKRPADEAFLFDNMFKNPIKPHKKRQAFKDAYLRTGDFEIAANRALSYELFHNRIVMFFHLKEVRSVLSRIKKKILHMK